MQIDNDTIIARSTAAGFGAIAIVRISGDRTKQILKNTTDITSKIVHRKIVYGNFYNGKQIVDQIMVAFFQAPNSYTGEDLAEINCHGSPGIVNKIIDVCCDAGARLAQPGEFTKRRFFNNKIDLTQAEGINNLIHSQTEAATRSSKILLQGKIGDVINNIKDQIVDNISLMELELDFNEEEIDHTPKETIINNIKGIINDISGLLKTYQYGSLVLNGLKIALTGPPNSGKSSLLNAIIKDERAITSAKAGTTRDFIQESIEHNGYKLTFIDTAGIRKPLDEIEHKGIDKSKQIIETCDLKLLIIDPTQKHHLYSDFIPQNRNDLLFVINKIDIADKESIEKFKNKYNIHESILVSALEHTNIEQLNDKIVEWLEAKKPKKEEHIITVQRHNNQLKATKDKLGNAIDAINSNYGPEFIVTDLRDALSSLDEILGKTTNDEILNNIFNDFCIGK